ncbi:glycoside hydrolase family 5 protein [Neolentinus lepideus HHB14362 ss-1]|uniref:cellulase n=1 Tax=Neolentinus lepideus HHB14362 ss-1 TaxID=1314782 RepID=A0A165UEQ1_9AGAM|nr:glycoside hydrolase family 5 protein [Neolentinus lepideus HHB14362 ss-1]
MMKALLSFAALGLSSMSARAAVLAPRVTGPSPLKFAGVNIAGFDFGCGTDGTCTVSGAYPPLAQYYGADGIGQMTHFVNDDGYNLFRLPVSWQYLTNNVVGGTLNSTTFGEYNTLVQACLNTGAYCIIDIHNYARWNGDVIGQGGPTNAQFAALWSSLATQYESDSRVMFGIMNEPHDLPSITTWAATVQAAVTAIRQAGATSQYILLSGDNYSSAATFVSNGSAAALATVTNLDGSTTNLVFDVHKYLDSDNSGTSDTCVTNNTVEAWIPLSTWLRANDRLAINTETGGGNTQSCVTYLCEQVAYQKTISDVLLGYVGWAAGNFATSYVLSETPTNNSGVLTDSLTVSSCLAPIADA